MNQPVLTNEREAMSEPKNRANKAPELENYSDSSTYRRIKCENFTVEGFSRAPVMTFWRVPEYKLGFDLGWQPWEFMGTPRWFLSHTHMDHVLALPAYVARRRMMQMEPPTIYLPEQKVNEVRQFLGSFCKLEQSSLPCELIGVRPGDVIDLSRELVVTVHKTFHTVPSVGYIIWERRKKLKPEFLELSGEQIRDLNLSGVEISYELRFPRIAFLGDSSARGLDQNPDMFKADVLVAEMTHVSSQRNEPNQTPGHMRVEDYAARKDRFENQKIIASHFSVRYPMREIESRVREKLPDMLGGRLVLV